MTQNCQNCTEHSSVVLTNNFLAKNIEDLKQELAEHKGYVNAKLDGTSNELKELRKEMIAEINKKFDELKALIEGKEKEKNNKLWNIGSPLFVGAVLVILQHFWK